MFEMLFGAEMPLAVRFFLAFLISLALFGATAWAVLWFGKRRLGGANSRARLAVVDRASVDEDRQLILFRRDNVEHLLMIGGPTDVVVEANIVRAAREVLLPRPPVAAGPLLRATPSPERGLWRPQPEQVAPGSAPRIVLDEPATAMLSPQLTEPGPHPPRESLVALAEEIAVRPVRLSKRAGSTAQPHPAEPRAPLAQAAPIETAADQVLAELAHRLDVLLLKPNAAPSQRQALAAEAAPMSPPPVLAPHFEREAGATRHQAKPEQGALQGPPQGDGEFAGPSGSHARLPQARWQH